MQQALFELLYAGVGQKAAVDGQRHAGDEAGGLVVEEEQQGAVQLLGLAEAAHGRGGQDLAGAGGGGAVGVPEEGRVLGRGEEPGGRWR